MSNVSITIRVGDEVHSEVKVSTTALDAVLFDFNTTASAEVTQIKAMCAGVISRLEDIRHLAGFPSAKARVASYAITQMEIAQMAAVKALFAKA